jgi:hypothetical protein
MHYEVQRILATYNHIHTVCNLWQHPYPQKIYENRMIGTITIWKTLKHIYVVELVCYTCVKPQKFLLISSKFVYRKTDQSTAIILNHK